MCVYICRLIAKGKELALTLGLVILCYKYVSFMQVYMCVCFNVVYMVCIMQYVYADMHIYVDMCIYICRLIAKGTELALTLGLVGGTSRR